MPPLVARDALRELIHEVWSLRAGADDAHLAEQHIDELRELIERVAAHKRSQFRASGIVRGRPHRAGFRLRIHVHRTKLQAPEHRVVAPDALLHEKDRPRRGEFHEGGKEQQQRREQHEYHARYEDVQPALQGAVPAAQGNLPHLHHRQAAEIADAQLVVRDELEGVGVDGDIHGVVGATIHEFHEPRLRRPREGNQYFVYLLAPDERHEIMHGAKYRHTEYVYSLTLLQVYNGEGDAIMMLTDLDAARRAMLKKEKDLQVGGQDIFVEIVLSFLGNPRTLFHKIGEEAFSIFSSEIRSSGLQSLIDILDTEESLEGQQELFNPENDDDVGSQSSTDSEDGSEDGSDVEVVDGREGDLAGSASSASGSDESGESENDDSSDEGSSEDDAELTEFNNLLALTLQTSKPKLNGEAPDESSDESDMDDDQMMALDPQLTKIFRQRSKTTNTKQQRMNAKQNVVHFKSRALDLLAIYLAKQCSNPLLLDLLIPLLRRTRGQANEKIADKVGKVLRTFFNTRTKHKASLPVPEDVEAVWEVLKGIHEEAKMGGGAKTHANTCSSASLYVVKVLVGLDKSNYSRAVDVYAETQKQWFLDGKSPLQPMLFTQFQNWSQEKRKQKK